MQGSELDLKPGSMLCLDAGFRPGFEVGLDTFASEALDRLYSVYDHYTNDKGRATGRRLFITTALAIEGRYGDNKNVLLVNNNHSH